MNIAPRKEARNEIREQRHLNTARSPYDAFGLALSRSPKAPTPTARHTTNPPVPCLSRQSRSGRLGAGRARVATASLGVRRPILARLRRAAAACMDAQGSATEGRRSAEGHRVGAGLGLRPMQTVAGLDNKGMKRNASPAFFTERSLAAYLAVSDRTVRNWIRRRELPSYKLGAARRIDPADVDAFLAARRDGKRHIAKPTWNGAKGTFARKHEAQQAIDEAYGLSDAPTPLASTSPPGPTATLAQNARTRPTRTESAGSLMWRSMALRYATGQCASCAAVTSSPWSTTCSESREGRLPASSASCVRFRRWPRTRLPMK